MGDLLDSFSMCDLLNQSTVHNLYLSCEKPQCYLLYKMKFVKLASLIIL